MKPYYYTFEWKDRVITLCLIVKKANIETCQFVELLDDGIYIGYSVKLPQDVNKPDFAQQIALGRANKKSTRIYVGDINVLFIKDKGVLKAIARNCERNIKDGKIIIKGIR